MICGVELALILQSTLHTKTQQPTVAIRDKTINVFISSFSSPANKAMKKERWVKRGKEEKRLLVHEGEKTL